MRVLVTGGAGYIGSHMVKRLLQSNVNVTILDDMSAGVSNEQHGAFLVRGRIDDVLLLKKIFTTARYDAVIHFAGYTSVSESVASPEKYFHNNFAASLALLNVATQCGVKKFIFSSTAAIFGSPAYIPIDESHPTSPINAYGESKLMFEWALKRFEIAHDVRWISLRYFNAAGADPQGELGEQHEPETHLIPLALRATYSAGQHLTIYGTDYDTPDGTCIRDYVHVCDLCEAHMLAVDHLIRGGSSKSYNLGNGEGYSVLDIIRTVENVTGQLVHIKHGPRRLGDPSRLVADSSKIREELGWKPLYDLDAIVNHAWAWECRGV
jgi:UDP-glucose 4-epimerase